MKSRAELLAESLRESAARFQQEDDLQAQIARVTALAKPEIDKLLAQHKAETTKPMSCPHCGEPLPESWSTDPTTSGTSEDDEDNEPEDDDDPDDDDYDNRQARLNKQNPVRPLSGLTRAQIMASLNKIRC